jgi:hypothetical protein
LVAEIPAERRACIVRSEAARKLAVCKYTNRGATSLPSLALSVVYATGASSSRRRPRSQTPHPSSSSDDDEDDSGRFIGPEDFVKDPVEEEHALAEAVA